jgi:hypothetical protein
MHAVSYQENYSMQCIACMLLIDATGVSVESRMNTIDIVSLKQITILPTTSDV